MQSPFSCARTVFSGYSYDIQVGCPWCQYLGMGTAHTPVWRLLSCCQNVTAEGILVVHCSQVEACARRPLVQKCEDVDRGVESWAIQ